MAGSGGTSGGMAKHLENFLQGTRMNNRIERSDPRVTAIQSKIDAAYQQALGALKPELLLAVGRFGELIIEIDPARFAAIRQQIAQLNTRRETVS